MCLYETKLKNMKYLTNKKNKGVIPECKDSRQLFIKTGCGWCLECRKQLANYWRIRLTEEIKDNEKAVFVTLSFAPESIKKLELDMYLKEWRGIRNDDGEMETDVNLLAGYAIRMWCERWRKHNKKAPKHWLITELGHKNSERIHLHGLIWGNVEMIEKTWKYGNIYCGQWVDNRTINYIMKYVTKLDELHQGYKQKIFTSKGIGKGYIDRYKLRHKYVGEKTITTYRTNDGKELGLPRYYKEKLFTEDERSCLWSFKLDENKIWLGKEEIKSNMDINEFNKKLVAIRESNERAGFGNHETGNKKYIITDIMKMSKDEVIDYERSKLVQCVSNRKIANVDDVREGTELSKSNLKTDIHYGEYIGTTTEAQRNYNDLVVEASNLGISVRVLRLMKDGLV